jgi:hypothetical protein
VAPRLCSFEKLTFVPHEDASSTYKFCDFKLDLTHTFL